MRLKPPAFGAKSSLTKIRETAEIEAIGARWRWEIVGRTLLVRFNEVVQTLGWAPLGGGYRTARIIANHQIVENDRSATEAPREYLETIVRALDIDPSGTVAMMTGADVRRAAHASSAQGALVVDAWCTAGSSNALRAGDRATHDNPGPGTINLILAINRPLAEPALSEAIQIATEARVLAVQQAGILSKQSGKLATGTGTDCIVVAAPVGAPAHQYCGKHTVLGELIGRAVLASCAQALERN